jgi:hypothetical protein
VKPWEIQRKRAEKRRREEARRERKKNPRAEPGRFRLVKVGGAGAGPEVIVASVIVKNPDESVFEAGFDELEPGMALVLEDEKGLIQKGIVEEKVPSASEEELPVLTVRIV